MRYKIAVALFNSLNYVWQKIDDFFFWLTEKIWDHSNKLKLAKQYELAAKRYAEKGKK